MKATVVDREGNVRCPVCGAADFSDKRTGKAKWGSAAIGVVTFGVGGALSIAAMPKRLKCRGCGENLKRGDAPPKRPSIDRLQDIDSVENRPASPSQLRDSSERPPRSAFRPSSVADGSGAQQDG